MDIIHFSKKKRRIKLLSVKLLYQSKVATDLNIWCTFQYLLIKKILLFIRRFLKTVLFTYHYDHHDCMVKHIFFRSPAFTMVSSLRTSSYLHICKFNTSLETFPNWNWYTSAKVRIWVTVIDLPAYMESF